MSIKIYIFSLVLCVWVCNDFAYADEITLPYKGLTLNADLALVQTRSLTDGVILITHGTLAHRDMETIVALRSLLKDKGYNTLAINLSLGLNNRHGMYDCKTVHRHQNEDAVNEIGAWVDWLKAQGVTRVALLGHSRGGAQTALYATEHDGPLVKAVVLLAPATGKNSDAASYQQRYRKPLAPVFNKARKLVKQGKGNAILQHTDLLSCPDASVTANTFASYYSQDPKLDTPHLIPKIKKPTLIVVAGKDEIVVGLDKKVAPLANGKNVQMKIIDDADHFFRDLYADETVDAIDAFLKNVGY